VVKALVARGVEARWLMARDQGNSKPVCVEPSEDCQVKNRRVEFEVLKRSE
jgi:outer membrane protein OmpA-like peptidoglycan-associated protein